jgi:myo-inositol 2-dehydrogenase / D-chiro-inositol 1-dehydrogenase
MRLGLLGCGNVAYWIHLRALRGVRGASLVAAADPDSGARERASRVTRARLYARAEDLLGRDDIDAVVICAPTSLHADLATAAAAAGKHVYLEKPIATSSADARRVIEAAARAGITAALGFNRRQHPLFQQARRLIADGAIGSVRGVQAAFCEPSLPDATPEWKRRRAEGGGVLLDLASHHIDQLRWTLGDEVARVAASLRSEATEHDTATIELETAGGVQVQGFYSFRAALTDHLTFIGERGSLRVDRHAGSLSLRLDLRRRYGTRRPWVAPSAAVAAWRVGRLWRPAADPSYRRSLQGFVRAVRDKRPPDASLTDGLRSLEVVLAAEDAAGKGRHVTVERWEAQACAYC